MKKLNLRKLFMLLFFTGCASSRNEPSQEVTSPGALHSSDPSMYQAPAQSMPAAGHATPASHGSGHGHGTAGVEPDQALKWLKNGNLRYLKNRRRTDGLSQKDRARLSTGQKPHSIILSCSDSRVPPEHVFDQALGEIFVIRVAGQALDSMVIGSIEYAVEHLGSRLIVVMGHESCGAVKAAITTPRGQSTGSPHIDRLVADLLPRLPASQAPSPNVVHESSINAKGVAADLVNRSQIVKTAVLQGKVKIVSGIYYLKSGQVEFFN